MKKSKKYVLKKVVTKQEKKSILQLKTLDIWIKIKRKLNYVANSVSNELYLNYLNMLQQHLGMALELCNITFRI